MKKNVLFQVLSCGLILISMSLLTGCYAAPDSPAAAEPADTRLSAEANMPPGREVETSLTIDPADRKFFTPGYGVNAGGYGETEALSNIDPADRKFFTPGYGVNVGGNDLNAYHESEWGRTPNTGLGVEENALAVYHQSEWGRTTGLSVEALSKIDPADRKFFNAGYRAQAVMFGETVIDPADRKFFSAGYGAQTVVSDELGGTLPAIENKISEQTAILFLLK